MSAQPPSILVVDDEPVVRRLVVREVERLGCGTVVEAANGIEAKRLLEASDFDLVITDVMMPELDGLGLMRWAQEKRGRKIPAPVPTKKAPRGAYREAPSLLRTEGRLVLANHVGSL